MPENVLTNSTVTVGVADSGKPRNAKQAAAAAVAAEAIKGKQLRAPEGGKLYQTIGDSILSYQVGNHFVDFVGGYYPTADPEEIEALEWLVKINRIKDVTNDPVAE